MGLPEPQDRLNLARIKALKRNTLVTNQQLDQISATITYQVRRGAFISNPKKTILEIDRNLSLTLLPQTHTEPLETRIAVGKWLRERASRKSQTEWKPPTNRPDPVGLLIENSQGRLEDLIPIRYGRMSANSFAFYRGAAAIMVYDLSHTPSTGLNIQLSRLLIKSNSLSNRTELLC
jgi:hypothetical protein